MKKLLNTLYLTQDNFYLTRERDNIVIKQEGKVISRFPYRIIDGIVCFSYLGASPSLIELCAENQINLSFHTPARTLLRSICWANKWECFAKEAALSFSG